MADERGFQRLDVLKAIMDRGSPLDLPGEPIPNAVLRLPDAIVAA